MEKHDKLTECLKRSAAKIGQLYPVLVDAETGEVLDGRTRLKVDPNWHKKELSGLSQLEKLQIKHHANWHRKIIDRQKVLTEIAEETGWRGLKPFADFLDVSEMTISRYLPQKYKNAIQSVNAQNNPANSMLAKKVEKASQVLSETVKAVEKANCAEEKRREIVHNLKMAEQSLSLINENVAKENSTEDKISQWLNQIEADYSLWECEEQRPEGFGDKNFHGNCSPTIVFALLMRYSTLNHELILDPMAGSGTFIDVAKKLGYEDRQIIAYDIRPIRSDVKFGDAEHLGLPNESVDFIFTHFPYWKLVQYSDNKDDLSNLNLQFFIEKSEAIIKEMHRVLRKNRFFVIMIGNYRKEGILDLEAQFSMIGSHYFVLWDKIVKRIRTWQPETRGQRMGLAIARARQHGYSIVNHDTILVFRKK